MKKGKRKPSQLAARLTPVAAGLRQAMYGGAAALALMHGARAELPVPASTWIPPQYTGGASLSTAGNHMTVNQHRDQVVLDWQSFNISADASVNFVQPGPTAAALNRIHQADPSRILGSLEANGQVFLINRNGVIFGEGSRVNTHTLVASSLNLSEEVFEQGLATAANRLEPALRPFTDSGGAPLPSGAIIVEADAELSSASFGRLLLAGSSVENHGTLKAPDGQVILAAGDTLFLQNSANPDLRGFLVEVGSGGTVSNSGEITTDRGNTTLVGLAVNQSGRISASTSVNANGSIRLLARDQGSVIREGGQVTLRSAHTGNLVVDDNSETRVLAEVPVPGQDPENIETAVDEQIQQASRIELMGKTIHLRTGSRLEAKGGAVELLALLNPNADVLSPEPQTEVRIQMDDGATIDVSGHDLTKEMRDNLLEVELRGNELADAPLQKNGPLRGQKVTIDIREGTPLADISAFQAGIRRNVAERLSAGGTVHVSSQGEVRLLAGSSIDVSGGTIRFPEGTITTSQLIAADGKVVDVGKASPDQRYLAVAKGTSIVSTKWGNVRQYVSGAQSEAGLSRLQGTYEEGKNAGQLTIEGPLMLAQGGFVSNTTVGEFQRDIETRPNGGKLVIGSAAETLESGFRAPHIRIDDFTNQPGTTSLDFNASLMDLATDGVIEPQQAITLQLDRQVFSARGFQDVHLMSNGRITLAEGPALEGDIGGTLDLNAGQIVLQSDIRAPAGVLTAYTDVPNVLARADLQDRRDELSLISGAQLDPVSLEEQSISLADDLTVDVAGYWTNDNPRLPGGLDPTAPIAVNGGRIELRLGAPGTLRIGDRVWLNAQGGGYLDPDLQRQGGDGGLIYIDAGQRDSVLELGSDLMLSGHGMRQGGRLELKASGDLAIEGDSSTDGVKQQQQLWSAGQLVEAGQTLWVPTALFSTGLPVGGFSEIAVGSANGSLTQKSGSHLERVTQHILPGADLARAPTGTRLGAVALGRVAAPPDVADMARIGSVAFDVQPNHLELSAAEFSGGNHNLLLEPDTLVRVTPGGSILLNAATNGLLSVHGELIAPGGSVHLSLLRDSNRAYNPGHQLWLGEGARIDVRPAFVPKADPRGGNRGTLLPAGRVTLESSGFLFLDKDSLIDVSGQSFPVDLESGGTATLASPGGTVHLSAAEGLIVEGDLRGMAAATGTGGGAGLLQITARPRSPVATNHMASYPTHQSGVLLGEMALPDHFSPGNDPNLGTRQGGAWLNPETFADGGFDRLVLQSTNGPLTVQGNTSLSAARSVQFFTDRIELLDNSLFEVSAPLVRMGRGSTSAPEPIKSGTGELRVNAGHLQLEGSLTVEGANRIHLQSSGDILLQGGAIQGGGKGELLAQGSLLMEADRIYPATLTNYEVSVLPDAIGTSLLHLLPGSGETGVLSAAGVVHLKAEDIIHQGTLLAPFGQLLFEAGQRLVVDTGSLTSVSGDGLVVPFGFIQNDLSWLYNPTGGPQLGALTEEIFSETEQRLPEKRVELIADDVDVRDGATLDLSGGGLLLGYEFIPGPGGSQDVLLANPAAVEERFWALLPDMPGFAPFDAQESTGRGLLPGDRVYLGRVPGLLEAGTYTLLPSRYALLPGAVLVEKLPGGLDTPLGTVSKLADGTSVVAGFRTALGIRDPRTSGFAVRPGNYVHQLSEYRLNGLDQFTVPRAAQRDMPRPALSADAADLLVLGGDAIRLAGNLKTGFAPGGIGVRADISANNLVVVNELQGLAGQVELLDADLNNLGVSSLLLGGTRRQEVDGLFIDPLADRVSFAPASNLEFTSLMAVARNDIHLGEGAHLSATGIPQLFSQPRWLEGDSAYIEISGGDLFPVQRSALSGVTGRITLLPGATIRAPAGAITLDGTADVISQGTLSFGDSDLPGGSLWIASSAIHLGDAPQGASGFVTEMEQLSALAVKSLFLVSNTGIDIHDGVSLELDELVLDGAGLRNFTSDSTHLQANTLQLRNSRGATVSTPSEGNGSLLLSAQTIDFASGDFLIGGFQGTAVILEASDAMTSSGMGTLNLYGDLQLRTPTLLTETASRRTFDVSGNLFIDPFDHVIDDGPGIGLGGELRFAAENVVLQSVLHLNSGFLDLHARGELGSVVLAGSAKILAGGLTTFTGLAERVATPGGRVHLRSDTGQIVLLDGTEVDVSGAPGGDAGALQLSAPQGFLLMEGTLLAGADTDRTQGDISIDAESLLGSDFSALNRSLNKAGFTHERIIRLRQGDVLLKEDHRIQANTLVLVAEQGALGIHGTIDASGQDGGDVSLWAEQDLWLGETAKIDAGGSDGDGGKILLSSNSGSIDLAPGSWMNVAGAPQQKLDPDGFVEFETQDRNGEMISVPVLTSDTGQVILRAEQLADYSDLRLERLAGTIEGAARIDLEGVRVYQTNLIDSALRNSLKGDAEAFAAHESAIFDRLGVTHSPLAESVHLTPGIEVRAAGDLLVSGDWNLLNWRFDGQPGILTLRAGGNLSLQGELSDGFSGNSLAGGYSWSYRLNAGADLLSPYLMATLDQASSDMTLHNPVRTGTGDIHIATAGNLNLPNPNSLIYSGGVPSGFDLDRAEALDKGKPAVLSVPVHGGDLSLTLGGDLYGPGDQFGATQIGVDWLVRNPFQNEQKIVIIPGVLELIVAYEELAGWAVDFSKFAQQIGAFGGGDLRVKVAGDLVRTSLSVPSTAALDPHSGELQRFGRGTLDAQVDGDVLGGFFLVGDGRGTLYSRGSMRSGRVSTNGVDIGTLFALMGGELKAEVKGDIQVQTIFDPVAINLFGNSDVFFPSFTGTSTASLSSVTGSVETFSNSDDIPRITNLRFGDRDALEIFPGTLELTAHSGNLTLGNIFQAPAAQGNVRLLASRDLSSSGLLQQFSAPESLIRGPGNPLTSNGELRAMYRESADSPLHENDFQPSLIVAENGNINLDERLTLLEPVHIIAGQDLTALQLRGQNNRPSDLTQVSAGRDILFRDNSDVISVAGPGNLLVSAGRDLDLGFSRGVETTGNIVNPRLPEQGAGITVLAGVDGIMTRSDFLHERIGTPLDDLQNRLSDGGVEHLVPDQATLSALTALLNQLAQGQLDMTALADGDTHLNSLEDHLDILFERLLSGVPAFGPGPERISATELLASPEGSGDTPAALLPELMDFLAVLLSSNQPLSTRLTAMTDIDQQLLANELFFSELRRSGEEAGQAIAKGQQPDYSRGFSVIESLFATAPNGGGDLSLLFSKIYSVDGGEINILVPRGAINAGVNVKPANADEKGPGDLGIVTQGEGELNLFSDGDFLVNASRAMTLGGGDLTAWSSRGNIDAGKGAKSALAAPAPNITVDNAGNVKVDFAAAVAGSGIRTVAAGEGTRQADAFLIAPSGEVSAGDAGIDVSGRVVIAAPRVVGIADIQAGAGVNLAPAPDTSLSGLSSLGGVMAGVTKSVEERVSENARLPSGIPHGSAQPELFMLRFEFLGTREGNVEEEKS